MPPITTSALGLVSVVSDRLYAKPDDAPLRTRGRTAALTSGRTHASIVKADEKSRSLASATVTTSSTPSNERPPPYLPVHAGPLNVAVWSFGDRSSELVPVPSLKDHAATRVD